jgi:hypothetical protein
MLIIPSYLNQRFAGSLDKALTGTVCSDNQGKIRWSNPVFRITNVNAIIYQALYRPEPFKGIQRKKGGNRHRRNYGIFLAHID